jgi:hypothetical protein
MTKAQRRVALVIFLHLVLAAAAAGESEAVPMELYFSPAELARIAGYGEEPVSSVSVSGQVTCELCARPGAHLLAFELPGIDLSLEFHRSSRSSLRNGTKEGGLDRQLGSLLVNCSASWLILHC